MQCRRDVRWLLSSGEKLALVSIGDSESLPERQASRRQCIEVLVDPETAFLELSMAFEVAVQRRD
jgi:hypothetical protein